jgi:hypothetical protein
MKKVRNGQQVAYRVALIEPRSLSSTGKSLIPPCIQQVFDKHSKPGGVLSDDISYGQTAQGFEMQINIDSSARPVSVRQYRLTPKERDALLSNTEGYIKRGWIEPSTSGWNSPVLFVPKPNGSLRFCVDYRILNRVTHKDAHQTPLISEVLDGLQGAKIFTALDLCSGFYQIPLAKGSLPCSAFSTPSALFQWCVMPMGLSNSPAVFQRAMNHVLRTHIKAGYCYVYLDDILIMSFSIKEHASHLDAVLTALRQHNIFCQLPKCDLALSELRYLGHLVNGAGVKPDPKKVAAIDGWKPPLTEIAQLSDPTISNAHIATLQKTITKRVRSFFGFMQYLQQVHSSFQRDCCSVV